MEMENELTTYADQVRLNISNLTTSREDDTLKVPEALLAGQALSRIITIAIVGSLIILLTFTGQLVVFYVVRNDRRLHEPSNYFITCLAIADSLISLVLMPVWTLYTALGYWPFGEIFCALWNAADYSFCTMSINIICLIATDRFLCLKYPFTYPVKRTGTVMKIVLCTTCFGSCLLYSSVVLTSQYYYRGESDPNMCITNFVSDVTVTILIITFALWIPILVTVVMYVLIFNIASNVTTRSLSLDNHNGSADIAQAETIMKRHRKTRDHLRAVKTIGCLLAAFVFCWMPYTLVITYHSLNRADDNPWLLTITYWLCYLNSTLNPFCYALGNTQFRETLLRKVLRQDVVMSPRSSSAANQAITL